MGHPPTGRPIQIRTMDIHQVRGGKFVATWHLEDFAGLMTQLSAPQEATPPTRSLDITLRQLVLRCEPTG
jgi:hypothetical protein